MSSAPKLCAKCREAMRAYQADAVRRMYHRRSESNSCTRCGRRPERGKTLCRACAATGRVRQRESYERRRTTTSLKRCSRCGELGHNARGCATRAKEGERTR